MTGRYQNIAERIDFMSRRHADRDRLLIELERHMVEAEIDRALALRELARHTSTAALAERWNVSQRTVERWVQAAVNTIATKTVASVSP